LFAALRGDEACLVGEDDELGSVAGAGFGHDGRRALNAPVVTMASTPDNDGRLRAVADGGVFASGTPSSRARSVAPT
jgi:hypothetical protein